jgi:hypothetical protein
VEATIHPITSIAAFFVDQVTQAPVVVQCTQAVPEPRWKWLVQPLSGLIPVAGGVGIALWSFSAASKREHERWVLDQKKADWSAVLSRFTAADIKLPHVFKNVEWLELTKGLLPAFRDILSAMRNVIFIADILDNGGMIDAFVSFTSNAAERIKKIEELTQFIDSPSGITNQSDLSALNIVKIEKMAQRETVYGELYDEFHKQADGIRQAALNALITPGAPRLS